MTFPQKLFKPSVQKLQKLRKEKDFSSGRTERKNAPPARDSSSIIALSYHFPILYY